MKQNLLRQNGKSQKSNLRLCLLKKWMVVPLVFLLLTTTGIKAQNEAPTFKTLANSAGIYFGSSFADYGFSESPFQTFFENNCNLMSPDNEMKMNFVESTHGSFNYTAADKQVAFAQTNGIKYHAHLPIWYFTVAMPDWLKNGSWDRTSLLAEMKLWIDNMYGRYKGKVAEYDVVNEAFRDNYNEVVNTYPGKTWENGLRLPADDLWIKNIGTDYIDQAFIMARAADPNGKLFYNDYDAEGLNQKSEWVYLMAKSMKERGIPIDGIGMQMHVQNNNWSEQDYVDMATNIKRLHDLGLEVAITELDVRMKNEEIDFYKQADVYKRVLQVVLDNKAYIKNFSMWGITDKHTWITDYVPGWGHPLILDDNYAPKPAYWALKNLLNPAGDHTAPAAPTNLTLSNVTATGGTVTWTAASDNVGVIAYDVILGTGKIITTTATSYTFSGLTAGVGYNVNIKARDNAANLSTAAKIILETPGNPTVITKTNTAITVDGTKDALYDGEVNDIKNLNSGTAVSGYSGNWTAKWDNNNLYVYVNVVDAIKQTNKSANWYERDGVEIYFDGDNNKPKGYGPQDFHYFLEWGTTTALETNGKSSTGVVYKYTDNANGYTAEVSIPWNTLNTTPAVGNFQGFEVMLVNSNTAQKRDCKLAWFGTNDNAWADPSIFGNVKITGPKINATGLTLTPASVSVAADATTQLTATVQPSDASNKNVNWTVNRAVAIVSASGLVTGVFPGTTNITATTVDGGFTKTSALTVTAASSSQTPYSGVISLPGKVETENYDNGGQNVAYFDNDATNNATANGTTIRTTEGVDVEPSTDTGGGYNVGWTLPGEWIEYTINPTAGTYSIDIRSASAGTADAEIEIVFSNGNKTTGNIALVKTGGWQTWTTTAKTGVVLNGGQQTMRVYINKGDVNLNYFNFTSTGTPPTVNVTGVSVSPTSVSVGVSGTSTLTATVTPGDATNKNVNWSSSNTSIVTVDAAGVVTGVAAGSATITVTTVDQGKTASCAVTVTNTTVAVTSVNIAPTSISVAAGATSTLTATVNPSNATNKNVTWSSTNTAVATVNSSGVVTGVAAGTANVTVTSAADNTKSDVCAVTVTGASGGSSTAYEAEAGTIGGGTGIQGASNASGGQVTGNMNATGAYVQFNSVNGGNGGTSSVTITFANGSGGTRSLSLYVNGTKVQQVSFANTGDWNTFQTSSAINITLNSGTGNTIKIQRDAADNPAADIDKITVTTNGGSSAVAVTGVSVSPTSVSVGTSATTTLTATVTPSDATNKNVSWSSSNTSIATVSTSGVVTGVAAGSATITVTTTDQGKTASCAVMVTASGTIASNVYEAEAGTIGGGTGIQFASNASGQQVSGNMNATGAYVQFNSVNGNLGGASGVTITFANGSGGTRSLSLYVNGNKVQQVSFANTGGWNTFQTSAAINITLNSGTGNTIMIQRDAADNPAADIDKITVSSNKSAEVAPSIAQVSDIVSVYPNPVAPGQVLKIAINSEEKTTVSVYDITGKILLQQAGYPDNGVLELNNTQGLQGLYLVKIVSGNVNQTQRVIFK